jgi:alpha-tubulin suppressor-like RCC1 family protein
MRSNTWIFGFFFFLFFLVSCTDSQPNQSITAVKISVNGILLTNLNETRQLDVVITKTIADQPVGTINWVSSNPEIISVNQQGLITANATVGSSQITANVGGKTSNPILATVAPVKQGVVITTDASIASEATPINPDADVVVGYQYTILLDGTEPTIGSILVGNGEKTLFGKVIATIAENGKWRTTLEIVPLETAFKDFQISQPIDLSKTEYVPAQDTSTTFDVNKSSDNTYHFVQKPKAALNAASPKYRVGSRFSKKFNVGPLKCKAEASAAQIDFTAGLENTAFDIKPTSPRLESFNWAGSQKLLKFTEGSVSAHVTATAKLTLGAAGKLTCKLRALKPQFPLPGFMAVFSLHLPLGVGFSVESEAPLAEPTLTMAGDYDIQYDAGFCIGASCPITPLTKLTKFTTSNQKLEFKPNLVNPLTTSTPIKLKAFPFVYMEVDIVPTFSPVLNTTPLSTTILDWKAGLEAQFEIKDSRVLPSGEDSIENNYSFSLMATFSFLEDSLEDIKNYFHAPDIVPELKVSFSEKFAESPKGLVSANHTGNNAQFNIALTSKTTTLPFVGYNLVDIRVYRKKVNETSLTQIATIPAVTDQVNYTIPWKIEPNTNPEDEFIVLAKTKLPLFPFVQIGSIKLADLPPPLTITQTSPITLTVNQTQQLTATQNNQPATVSWSSSDSSIASVNSSGLVTGVKVGSVTVTATLSSDTNQTASVVVNVSSGSVDNATSTTISARWNHSLVVKTDGSLWAFGDNSYGQLGDGTIFSRSTPVKVMDGVASVSTGLLHSLVLQSDGTLWAFGYNGSGALGDGTTTNRSTPVRVMTGVSSVSAGGSHSLVVKTDGSLWAFGFNYYGQLGDGTNTNHNTPVQVMTGISRVSAGIDHSLVLKTDGSLWAFGRNASGELGDGMYSNRNTPTQIMIGVSNLSAGGHYSLVLKSYGSVWTFGDNTSLILYNQTPVQVVTGISSISAGWGYVLAPGYLHTHMFVLRTDASLMVSGWNLYGELGDGTSINRFSLLPIMTDVSSMSAGSSHSLVLKTDGSLWAFGHNDYGQLGDGTTFSRMTPEQIMTGVKLP